MNLKADMNTLRKGSITSKVFLVALTLSIFIGTSITQPVSAQVTSDESITLSPVSSKYKVDAGETVSDKLTVVNDGKTAYDFIVYSRPYSVTNEAYEPNFTDTPKNADAYSWVRFAKTKFHLEAGATIEVPYTVTVPQQAAPGGHYGVLFAETQPIENQTGGNSVVRKKRVGSILYATVNGQYITSGEVTSTNIPFWQLQPPLHAESSVKNTGNSDFTNDIVYTVKDVFGNVKYKDTKQYTVLPQTTRVFSLDWQESSWFGFYKVELEQTVLDKKTADSSYVLVLPRYIPILLLVLILVGGVYAWFRRKNTRSKKK
ncbi:MAG: hypothetical protein EOO39_11605 [Cytophagaceae bacterium]|nr:MAG: hypothetical protein EOO39_11605 [Cytophagaceae bacterium]